MARAKSLCILALLSLALVANTAEAQSYFPVPFTYNETLNAAFPTGSVSFGGVPFVIPTSGRNYWSSNTGVGPHSLDIATQRYGVTRVYTIINTFWGRAGGPYALLEFWGDDGAYYKKDLYGNVDIRDFNNSTWTNTLNGTTSTNVWRSSSGWRLDMQRIDLPPSFADQTLVRIRLYDAGAENFQRVFLSGVTLRSQYGTGGSMAQMASAGSWTTTVTLLNPGSSAATARLRFFDNDGKPQRLPFTFSAGAPEVASILDRTLQPGATLIVQTTGPDAQAAAVGWMQLHGTGSMTGFAVFRMKIGDTVDQEAVVPLETRDSQSYVLWFDNSLAYSTGVAIANAATLLANIPVEIRDETGRMLMSTVLPVSARGHASFSLAETFPVTAGIKGTVEFRRPPGGPISVLGLRFNPKGAFTTVPAVCR